MAPSHQKTSILPHMRLYPAESHIFPKIMPDITYNWQKVLFFVGLCQV